VNSDPKGIQLKDNPQDDAVLNNLVSIGLQFVKELTLRYGTEEGSKIWEAITTNLDPEAKDAILLAMLTGRTGPGSVWLYSIPEGEKVPAIRAIRYATGFGLKEAKDLADIVMPSSYSGLTSKPVEIKVSNHNVRHQLIRDLTACGCRAQ
jgi:ribosomal protein L7/L12